MRAEPCPDGEVGSRAASRREAAIIACRRTRSPGAVVVIAVRSAGSGDHVHGHFWTLESRPCACPKQAPRRPNLLPLPLPTFRPTTRLRRALWLTTPAAPPWDSQDPFARSCSASSASRSTRGAWRPPSRSRRSRSRAIRWRVASPTMARCSMRIGPSKRSKTGRAITPAAEWLIDNYHLVEKQIREIRADLPPGYYRQLPKLAAGPFAGLSARVRPRLGLRRPYRQPLRSRRCWVVTCAPTRKSQPLTIGELWARRDHAADRAGRESAAPRRADRRAAARRRQQADALADRLLGAGGLSRGAGAAACWPVMRRATALGALRRSARPAAARPGPAASRPR